MLQRLIPVFGLLFVVACLLPSSVLAADPAPSRCARILAHSAPARPATTQRGPFVGFGVAGQTLPAARNANRLGILACNLCGSSSGGARAGRLGRWQGRTNLDLAQLVRLLRQQHSVRPQLQGPDFRHLRGGADWQRRCGAGPGAPMGAPSPQRESTP